MMKGQTQDAAEARRGLPEALRRAAAHLREKGDFHFLNDEPDLFTTDELAARIEQSADRLAMGDESMGKWLWIAFAPTCTWDDAGGDSRLGQEVFELLDRFFRPA
ncbi:hypothetical protein [Prosthecobacter sp.]|uniref:hypothetical protein n=1 Tax=Prosthecobacter sp. TaxID=1965333 RepID=UPI0037848EE5